MKKIDETYMTQYPESWKKLALQARQEHPELFSNEQALPWDIAPSIQYPEVPALVEATPQGGQRGYVTAACALTNASVHNENELGALATLNPGPGDTADSAAIPDPEWSVASLLVSAYKQCGLAFEVGGDPLASLGGSGDSVLVKMSAAVYENLCPTAIQ